MYSFKDLKVNSVVMANYNIENPKAVGYWYDVRMTAINKTKTTKEIIGDVYIGRDMVLLENCRIISCDDVFKIERPTPISTRNIEEIEPAVACQNTPSCSRC
jgi:E3 ubiquitin-protein ligase UHRF2